MRILKSTILLAAAALFAFACAGDQPAVNDQAVPPPAAAVATPTVAPSAVPSAAPVDTAAAGKLFKTTCAKCHEHLDGGVHVMNGKRYKLPNFLSERMINKSDEEYVAAITHGIPDEGMPAFEKKLTAEQIKALVAYIRRDVQKQ